MKNPTKRNRVAKASPSKLFERSAHILKLAGIALIAITIVNYLMIFVPPDFTNPRWWWTLTSQIIEQGILPLFGLALVFAGFAINLFSGTDHLEGQWIGSNEPRAYQLSLLFGLIFLVMIPLHSVAAIMNSQAAIDRLDQELTKQEEQLQLQLNRQKQIYTKLLAGEVKVEDLVGSKPLTKEQMEMLTKIQDKPEVLDRQIQSVQTSMKKDLQERQAKARESSKFAAWKSIFRLGLTSFILSACYFNLAWIGLHTSKPKVKKKQAVKEINPDGFL